MSSQPYTVSSPLQVGRWIQRRPVRFALFWLTFLLGFLILVGFNFEALPFIILFPIGLFWLVGLQNIGELANWLLVVGWLIFLGVSLVGTFTTKHRTFVIMYIVFFALLIANMAGCIRGL